jgi:Uma2 family endonuclease
MSISASTEADPPREPAWDIARLWPDQGTWSVDDYLELTNSTNQRVELDDGNIEVLAMPTEAHEAIVQFLFLALHGFVTPEKIGRVFFTGIRVRSCDTKFRMPDIVFMLTENRHRRGNDYWRGADLVMEVVSPDDGSRKRDLVKKKDEYAEAGISEYWIVDPDEQHIRVLKLEGTEYVEGEPFQRGATAVSNLLAGFQVAVTEVFDSVNE